MKTQKVYHRRASTGKWGRKENTTQTLENKGKNINFFLHIIAFFYKKLIKN